MMCNKAFQRLKNLLYIYITMAKIIPSKPFLLLLYGFPGSGKTYFSRQFSENVQAAHLQADRIRNELFNKPRYDKQENEVVSQLMEYMAEEFLNAGVSVIYDVNAMRSAHRLALRDLARKAHAIPFLVWFQIDIESAFTRSIKRDRRRADDKFAAQRDRTSFEPLINGMQNPTMAENYVVVSGKHLYMTQQSAVISKLRENNVIKMDDSSMHVVKPGMVNLVPNVNIKNGRVDLTRRSISIR